MKTKICPCCKKELDLNEFFFYKKENRYNSFCKECQYEYQKQRWQDRKVKAVELMGGKCQICGYDKNYAALSFHHTNPKEKEFVWNKMRLKAWEDVIVELKKCILLCSFKSKN